MSQLINEMESSERGRGRLIVSALDFWSLVKIKWIGHKDSSECTRDTTNTPYEFRSEWSAAQTSDTHLSVSQYINLLFTLRSQRSYLKRTEKHRKKRKKNPHARQPKCQSPQLTGTHRELYAAATKKGRTKKYTPSAIKHIITAFFPPTRMNAIWGDGECEDFWIKGTEDECYISVEKCETGDDIFLFILGSGLQLKAERSTHGSVATVTSPSPLLPKQNGNEVFIKKLFDLIFPDDARVRVRAYQNGLYILFWFSFRIISRENNFQIQMFLFISVGIAYGFSSIAEKKKKIALNALFSCCRFFLSLVRWWR